MASAAESLKRLNIFQRPMCLISSAEDGQLKLEEEPLTEIEKIDMPLVVVAIAGLYRTGKSYLMNCLAGETKGFPLGNTTESETKGIWAWCKIHPKKEDQVLLLLDTEGLGDIAKGDKDHDNKIFTIAALLCNVLVFNMMTAFNQDAVEKLTFISEMSKNVIFRSGKMKKDEKFDLILPIFVLCLRDFSLNIEKDGEEMTADEYLGDCLELKAGKGNDIDKFNRPRECLRKYFPRRKCFTFDRPGNRSVMKRLETARTDELSTDFLNETQMFLNYIYSCKPKVLLSSKTLRGAMFATLATSYINAISSGAIPDVDDAIQMVAKMENERMARAAVEEFKTKVQTIKLHVLDIKVFNALYEDIQNECLANFRSEALFESEHFEYRAIAKMDKVWKVTKEQNSKLVKDYCIAQMKEIYGEIVGKKKESGMYFVSGGYAEYREDIKKVKKQFRKKMEELEECQVAQSLFEFSESEGDYESEVLCEDKKISEEDRKREIEDIKKDNQRTYEKQQRLLEGKMAEEKQRTEERYKRLESEREAYKRRDEEKMQLLMDRWNRQKELGEKKIQLMKAENEKQRKEFRDEIKQINEANCKREKDYVAHTERILTQEREFNKTQIENMKKGFDDMLESQQRCAEQRQADERNLAETKLQNEAMKHEEERRRDQIARQREQEVRDEMNRINEARSRRENEHTEHMLAQERELNKTQIENMKKGFDDMLESQQICAEQRQADERNLAETKLQNEAMKHEEERRRDQIARHREQEVRDEMNRINEARSRRENEHTEHMLAQERESNKRQNETMKREFEDFLKTQERRHEEERKERKRDEKRSLFRDGFFGTLFRGFFK